MLGVGAKKDHRIARHWLYKTALLGNPLSLKVETALIHLEFLGDTSGTLDSMAEAFEGQPYNISLESTSIGVIFYDASLISPEKDEFFRFGFGPQAQVSLSLDGDGYPMFEPFAIDNANISFRRYTSPPKVTSDYASGRTTITLE